MLLGITENLQERARIRALKKTKTVTNAFLIMIFLSLGLCTAFYLEVFPRKSPFSTEVQQPVAKVITSEGVGTAFLVTPTLLLTARHVLAGEEEGNRVDLVFEQSVNRYQTTASIKYIAPTVQDVEEGKVDLDYFLTDVAVLEISEITDIEPLLLGESDAVANLDEVILIGYPNGDYSITKGNINSDQFQGLNLFKLDAASNPGNSGGPCILAEDGTVVGILVGGSGPDIQGENVALKINDVKRVLRNVKSSI